jgi:hypothetical protein
LAKRGWGRFQEKYVYSIMDSLVISLPPEITEDMAPYEPPVEIPADKVTRDFKVLYAIGKK